VRVALIARGVPADQARDVAQEAWTRLLERARRGELRELRLPGLAITQAMFIAIDERRRAARSPVSVEPADIADPTASAEDMLAGRRRLERARTTLAALPSSSQAVFHAVFGGAAAGYAAVARELGLSEQRVKQIVCEIRAKVRAALEQDDG
jgi:RNA polymerase sigma-70 factor (ECF subfamily)